LYFISFFLDECKKYKEAIYLDPKYSISVTDILVEMLSKMMMKPIEALGDSIYVFNKSVLSKKICFDDILFVYLFIVSIRTYDVFI